MTDDSRLSWFYFASVPLTNKVATKTGTVFELKKAMFLAPKSRRQ